MFATSAHLDAAVEQLGIAGVDRAAMSMLSVEQPLPAAPDRSGTDAPARSIVELSDDPRTPSAAVVSDVSRSEARGMASAVPLAIGGFGAAWAVAAAGGALLLAIGATVAGGAVAAGLGALLYTAVARRHTDAIGSQMAAGGLILWVRVADDATEQRALAVLQACGGQYIHTHMIDRPWGVADSPLYGVQPDPFLEHDASLDPV